MPSDQALHFPKSIFFSLQVGGRKLHIRMSPRLKCLQGSGGWDEGSGWGLWPCRVHGGPSEEGHCHSTPAHGGQKRGRYFVTTPFIAPKQLEIQVLKCLVLIYCQLIWFTGEKICADPAKHAFREPIAPSSGQHLRTLPWECRLAKTVGHPRKSV